MFVSDWQKTVRYQTSQNNVEVDRAQRVGSHPLGSYYFCFASLNGSRLKRVAHTHKRNTYTRWPRSALFLSLTFSIRFSLFPPPPAVNSTLIIRPSRVEWCSLSACWSPVRLVNSRNAQPLDLFEVLPVDEDFGVSRRIWGGGSKVHGWILQHVVKNVRTYHRQKNVLLLRRLMWYTWDCLINHT